MKGLGFGQRDWRLGLEVGTRSPTESSDIQQKIVMMAIHEESSRFGVVSQMGLGDGCGHEGIRDKKKTIKKSLERGWVHSHHTLPAEHLVTPKPGGATT